LSTLKNEQHFILLKSFFLEYGGTKFKGCDTLKHCLQSITRVRILTLLSTQNEFHLY